MAETTEQYRIRIGQLKTSIENEPLIRKMREDIAEGISKTGNRQADIEDQFQSVIDVTTGKDIISAPEILAARTDAEGTNFPSLKAKNDAFELETATQFRQTEKKKADLSYVETAISQMTGGSIKGTFSTLEDLREAYKNGTDVGPFLVNENSNRYVWDINKKDWVTIGIYDPARIEIDSIIPDNLRVNYNPISDLIFEIGTIDTTNGKDQVAEVPRIRSTNFIKVDEGFEIVLENTALKFNVLRYSTPSTSSYIGSPNAWLSSYTAVSDEYVRINLRATDNSITVYDFLTSLGAFMSVPKAKTFIKDTSMIAKKIIEFDQLTDEAANKILSTNNYKTPEAIFTDYLLSGGNKVKLTGDSIVHGVGGTGFSENGEPMPNTDHLTNPNGHCFANSLRDLFEKKELGTVINWGVRGEDSQFTLDNIAEYVEEDDDLILLEIGTNDRYTTSSPVVLFNNLINIIDYVHSLNKKIILMSANAVGISNENDPTYIYGMFDVNLAIQKAAKARGMGYISNYNAFLEYEERTGNSISGLLADELHPNDPGYDLMFRNTTRDLGIGYLQNGLI